MNKRLMTSFLLIFLAFNLATSQTQNSKKIYQQVQELQSSFSAEPTDLFSVNRSIQEPADAYKYVNKAEYLQLNDSSISTIKKNKPATLSLEIPFEGNTYEVQVYQKDVTASSYQVKTSSGASVKKSKAVFYRGIIKDEKNSVVSLSVLSNSVHMTIATNEGNFEINKINENLYAAYRVSDSKRTQDTGCATDNLELPQEAVINENSTQRSFGDCIEVYIECDFDSFLENGSSVTETEEWALAVMNEVEILYDNEGVPMVVSELLVYDTSDPYSSQGSTDGMLDLMGPTIGNNYNGRLAHLFSTRNVGGGIAWLNVLCATNNGGNFGPYAVSGALSPNAVPFPIFSWNVMVVAHELGHNVGSSHTHSCVWNGNGTQIDDCGNEWLNDNNGNPGSCYDENNPILPNSGTIMSYCHLIGGVGINFNNGFGPLPGALLFDKYNSANCSTGDDCAVGGGDGGGNNGPAPVADFTVTQFDACAPAYVEYTNQSFNDPVSYEWSFPGGTPSFSTEEDPAVEYFEPGVYDVTLIATNSNGTDEYTQNSIIVIDEQPVPAFDFEITDNFIEFTNQTVQSVNSYFWDFGDGNVSTAENPLHAYLTDGTYTVTFTIENDCGVFEIQQVVEFYIPPTAGFNLDISTGCNPLIVSYTNNSSSNTVDILWTFEGGIPETSTDANPVVTYAIPGTYDVTLTASNDNGVDELLENNLISVDASPLADFGFSVDGQDVEFANLSNGFESVNWSFGDGNSSNEIHPTHTYDIGGTYEVTLLVESENCGISEISKLIDVTGTPIANIDYDIEEGCTGMVVSYTAVNSSSADTYLWNFEGGIPASSTEESIIVEYPVAGTFEVSLTVTNTVGEDMQTIDEAVVVYDTPTAEFSHTLDGLTIELFAVEVDNLGTMYSWDLGDGNMATGINATHTYSEEGIYDVTLYTTSLCGESEISETINTFTLPSANFTADALEGCADFIIQMTSTSSDNVEEWQWSFPGGTPASSTDENPTVTYSDAGTYSVQLTVSNAAGSDEIESSDLITVNDTPITSFTASSDMNTASFTNTTINANSYDWNFGDGNTSILENPTHTYDVEGTYEVSLRATNDCGTTEHTLTVFLSSAPMAGYSASINQGCIPLSVEFTDNSSSNVTGWNWSFPGGTPASSNEQSPTIIYEATGEYDVTLIVSSDFGDDTLIMSDFITSVDLPTASFQFISLSEFEYEFSNTSFDAESFSWDFGDGNTSSLENPSHTYAGPGTYLVTFSASNACGTETWQEEIEIEESTSIHQIEIFSEIGVFPNPNHGEFILSIDSKESRNVKITLYDVLGQRIMENDLEILTGKNQKRINLENAVAGAYLLVLRSEEQSQVLKLLVN